MQVQIESQRGLKVNKYQVESNSNKGDCTKRRSINIITK